MSIHLDKNEPALPGQTKDYYGSQKTLNRFRYPEKLELGPSRVHDYRFRPEHPFRSGGSSSSVGGSLLPSEGEDLRKRIPLCFRSHRDLAGCFDQKAELFEKRVNVRNESDLFWDESLQDNVAMWYPLDQRPAWVESKAYQRCQLMGTRRQRDEQGFSDKLAAIRAQPPAGSRLGSGAFPHSFDFSAGKCLQDVFYLSHFGENSSANERSYSVDAGRDAVNRQGRRFAQVPSNLPLGDPRESEGRAPLADNQLGRRGVIP